PAPRSPVSCTLSYTTLFRSQGGIQGARQDLGQTSRALEELSPLLAALPGCHPHAQAREHDDEQGGHDGQRDDHLDEREAPAARADRKSTRLNSSHEWISYAV